MSVINTRTGITFSDADSRCNCCGERLWPPFVEWHCSNEHIFICGECACRIKKGLMADLIQCAAIVDLQKLYGGSVTLVRSDVKKIEDQERKDLGHLRPVK